MSGSDLPLGTLPQARDPAVPQWSRELRDVVRGVPELLALLDLDANALGVDLHPEFALRVPRPFVARMRRGDPADPLLRQILPLTEENRPVLGFVADPLGERQSSVAPGLIQKYAGRVLLIAAGNCAVHCRYCFRRSFPYSEHRLSADALAAVRDDVSIREVIVSGGDPLMLTDAHFSRLLDGIEAIAHVERFRIHTRLPVVIPSRITSALVERLARSRLRVVLVLHVNHPNELDAALGRGVEELAGRGVTVLNQAVLLAGVNDDCAVLVALSEELFRCRILPYYLHQLDPVAGAHHMLVSDARAQALHREMHACLPGYLVPRLVRETAGLPAKEWLRA